MRRVVAGVVVLAAGLVLAGCAVENPASTHEPTVTATPKATPKATPEPKVTVTAKPAPAPTVTVTPKATPKATPKPTPAPPPPPRTWTEDVEVWVYGEEPAYDDPMSVDVVGSTPICYGGNLTDFTISDYNVDQSIWIAMGVQEYNLPKIGYPEWYGEDDYLIVSARVYTPYGSPTGFVKGYVSGTATCSG